MLIFSFTSIKSQHTGLFHTDYSPISAALVNPALAVNSYTFQEIKLLGASGQLHNNYLHWKDANLRSRIRDNTNKTKVNVFGEAEITAPSVIRMVERYSFGLFMRSRSIASIRNMPLEFAKFGFEGLDYPPQHGIIYEANNASVKGMTWGEINLHAGAIVKQYGNQIWSVATNLKILNGFGYGGVLFRNTEILVDSLNMELKNFDGQYAIAVPGWGKGYGAGLDIGLSYMKMLDDDLGGFKPHSPKSFCKKKAYKFRLAASVNDLGIIRFFNSGVRRNEISNQGFLWNAYNDQPVGGLSSFDFVATEKLKASNAQFDTSSAFNAYLPLAITAQADYNYENGFYARANLLLGLRARNSFGVDRMSFLNIALRYQTQLFEAELPLTINRIEKPGLGFNMRLWGLSFGTSNFLPLLFNFDTYSLDAYVSLSIPLYNNKECRTFLANQYRFYRGMTRIRLFVKKKRSQRYF